MLKRHPGLEVFSPRLPIVRKPQETDLVALQETQPEATATPPLQSEKSCVPFFSQWQLAQPPLPHFSQLSVPISSL